MKLYDLVQANTSKAKALLDAVTEMNALVEPTEAEGWSVRFTVMDTGKVALTLARDVFPSADGDAQ